jgi:hypothetical protein
MALQWLMWSVFPRAAAKRHHKQSGLQCRDWSSHKSECWKSKIKVSAGWCLSEVLGEFVPGLSGWPAGASFLYRLLHVSVSVSKFPFLQMKKISLACNSFQTKVKLKKEKSMFPLFIRIPVILDQGPFQWPHFHLISSVKTLFLNKVTFWGTGLRAPISLFLRDTIHPLTCQMISRP